MARDEDGYFDMDRALSAATTDDAAPDGKQRPALLSSALIGSTNRGRVVQALFDRGPTSRAELARLAGVNRTTISGIVQPLLDQQLLVEGDPLPTSEGGGKPARPLWFSPDARPICGILLMPDLVRTCLVTLEGRIYAEYGEALPADPDGPGEIIDRLLACTARARSARHIAARSASASPSAAWSIPIAAAIVTINLAPALDGFPLGDELARRFKLPVLLDHHPRALLVGDRWFGKGRGMRSFAVVYTGEVLGRRPPSRRPPLSRAGRRRRRTRPHLRPGRRRGLPLRPARLLGNDRDAGLASAPRPRSLAARSRPDRFGEPRPLCRSRPSRRRRAARSLCAQRRHRHRQSPADRGAQFLHPAWRRRRWRPDDDRRH